MATLLVGFACAAIAAVGATGCGPDYPNCDNDDQCHEHEFCVNHQCQQCRTDTDCPSGQSCTDGACAPIEGYCDATTACPSGEECVENRCRAAQTTEISSCASVTCPPGSRCEDGQCVSTFVPSCTVESVYFDYDSDALDESNRRTLQAAQRCIADSRPTSVHATGHADERGTEEYNLALSERRAQTVMRYLQTLGVSVELGASGMGEEMATGTTEEAWRHDRRVDLHLR